MSDRELAALIRLFDDDSDVVRDAVLSKLAAYGADLEAALGQLPEPPDADRVREILGAVELHRDRRAHTEQEARAAATAKPRASRPTTRTKREPRLAVGQLVRHKHYGYRGVVVSFDETCQADDDWYHNNRTQPDREQPWYHVLVDGTEHVTYAAQVNLVPDESVADVEHPLVPYFFSAFEDGQYVRNDRPWPEV